MANESDAGTRAEGHDGLESATPQAAELRTFLIADIRGYTTYTNEHGDEAAAGLARRFASLARQAVEARQGVLLELRGDEALALFSSARQALRAAVDLQALVASAELPRAIGIGLDTGEAVAVDEGYRGTALNMAARLCGAARGGQVIATETVVHLAARIEGMAYADPRTLRLKGFSTPVRVVDVVAIGDQASTALPRRTRDRRRIAAAALVAAVAVVGATLVIGQGIAGRPQASPRVGSASGAVLVAGPQASAGAAGANADIPYKGGLARTNVVAGPEPPGPPTVRWTFRANSDMTGSPVLAGGNVFMGRTDGTLDVVDVTTGREVWSFDAGARISAPPAVGDGKVFVTTADGVVRAIDLGTRKEVWRVSGTGRTALPAIIGQTVYVGFAAGRYAALSTADGSERWHVDIQGDGAKAAIAGGTAYVTSEDVPSLYAIALDSGTVRWTYQVDAAHTITPAVSRSTVYIVGVDPAGGKSGVTALDVATGTPRWRFAPPDKASLATLAVGDDLVYTSADAPTGTNLYAVDKSSGAKRWVVTLPNAPIVHPTIVAGHLYVAAGTGELQQIDAATGARGWSVSGGGPVIGTPVVAGGLVVVGTAAGGSAPGIVAYGTDPSASPEPSTVAAKWVADLVAGDHKPALYLNVVADPKGNVYGADRLNNRIVIWDPAGKPTLWGKRGHGPGEFDFSEVTLGDQSQSVAIAPDGRIAVGDGANHRVQIFDARRRFIQAIGRKGHDDGEFVNPCCVTFDKQGRLYVADAGRADIQVFDRRGAFVRVMGKPGSGNGQLSRPGVPFVDPASGNVFIPDFGNRRVQVMSPEGSFVATYGDGSAGFRLAEVNGVVVDQAGRMFVVDTDNLVYVLDPKGQLITSFGPEVPGHGYVAPSYLWLTADGTLYLPDTDPGGNRVVVLKLQPPLWPPP